MLATLKRGALSGLAAGALTALFGYLLAEPLMDRAVTLEEARHPGGGPETFSRATQHVGFGVAAVLVGLAFGVLYSVAYQVVAAKNPSATPWRRSVELAGAAWFGLSLVPFLRYPANPPGTGDPSTIDSRTHLWLASIAVGLLGAVAAGLVAQALATHRASLRQLAVAGVLVGTVALSFALPGNDDPIEVPVKLLWDFRLLSLASLTLLWGGLGVVFGLLSERVPADARELVTA